MRGRRPVTVRIAAALTAPAVLSVVLSAPALGAPSHDTVAGVPAGLREELAAAVRTCSDLPTAVLAAQLQAASGFDPDAVAPDGRRGVAGFSPSAWAHWGEDADGDGKANALDPADAVDALARKMCALYRLAVRSELRGDRLSLALAASEVGWSVVREAGGVPAAARPYVNRIWGLAEAVGPGARGAFGESAAARLVRPQAPPNPRGPLEAMRWARRQVGGDPKWYQLCLKLHGAVIRLVLLRDALRHRPLVGRPGPPPPPGRPEPSARRPPVLGHRAAGGTCRALPRRRDDRVKRHRFARAYQHGAGKSGPGPLGGNATSVGPPPTSQERVTTDPASRTRRYFGGACVATSRTSSRENGAWSLSPSKRNSPCPRRPPSTA